MRYIQLRFNNGDIAFQEISANETLVRYVWPDGTTAENLPHVGDGGTVTSESIVPSWALSDPIPEPVVEPTPVGRRLTKLAFVGRLGNDFFSILTAAKSSVEVEMFVKMLDWATPDADGTSVDLDDPRVIYVLNNLEATGLIAPGRAAEILSA